MVKQANSKSCSNTKSDEGSWRFGVWASGNVEMWASRLHPPEPDVAIDEARNPLPICNRAHRDGRVSDSSSFSSYAASSSSSS